MPEILTTEEEVLSHLQRELRERTLRAGMEGVGLLPKAVFVSRNGVRSYLYSVAGMVQALDWLVNHVEITAACAAKYKKSVGSAV